MKKYLSLLRSFISEYKKLEVLKRKMALNFDSDGVSKLTEKQEKLMIKYAKKFKKVIMAKK